MKGILFVLAFCFVFIRSVSLASQDLDSATPTITVLKKDSARVYLLGTLHNAHLRNPNYTWPHFDRIVSLISPQLLLLEIRPEHFSSAEYFSDGPLEMTYLAHLAIAIGIESEGFDWWPDQWLLKFDQLTDADFALRDNHMAKNMVQAVRERNANTTLVATGRDHIEPFATELKQLGYAEEPEPTWHLMIRDYPDLPQTVLDLWQRGAKYLSGSPIASSPRTQRKIELLNRAVQSRGYLFERSPK